MTEKRPETKKGPAAAAQKAGEQTYLNHGVESLVAMDSPDDPEAGTPVREGNQEQDLRK